MNIIKYEIRLPEDKIVLDRETFTYLMKLKRDADIKEIDISTLSQKDKIIKYLIEYENLCSKYKIGLVGCGCCGSPMLWDSLNNKCLLDNVNYENELKNRLWRFI